MPLDVALKRKYYEEVRPELIRRFGYQNVWEVPRLEKVVINQGLGEAKEDARILEKAAQELALITGQKPAVTRAKKSISNFKLRKGMPIGLRVTPAARPDVDLPGKAPQRGPSPHPRLPGAQPQQL